MEGLLAVVGLEVTTEGVMTGTGTEKVIRRGRKFQILGAATLKLRAPNDLHCFPNTGYRDDGTEVI